MDAGPTDLDTAYTVGLWAKADSLVQSSAYDSVFSGGDASSFQMDVDNATAGNYRWRGDTNVNLGPVATDWVHLAVTYDGTTLKTYYNGAYVTEGTSAGVDFESFFIGRNRANDHYYEGTIDDVYVYNRPLDLAEIDLVMSGGGYPPRILVENGAKLVVGGFINQGRVEVRGSGILQTAGATSSAYDLALDTGATLDLTTGNLVVDYEGDTPFRDIEAKVKEGFAGGTWAGTGITSSSAAAHPQRLAALACIDNSDPLSKVGWSSGLTSLDGVAVDATSILIKYTYYGDLNLDGIVDSNDYDLIDNTFAAYDPLDPINTAPDGGWRWSVGDVTYDGVVDSNDYDKIDNAFKQQTGGLGSNLGLPVPTPEPATMLLLGLGAAVAIVRKRRSR